MRSKLLPPLLMLAALALSACSKAPPAEEPVRAVRTQTVTPGGSAMVHEYAAEIRPRSESRLGFRVGGKLVERMVNLGDRVKAGQPLARLDASDLRLGQEAARATVQAAKVQLELAEADYQRYKSLRDQGFISNAELERRDTTLKAARAQHEQARAQAGVQENQAGYALLLADGPGVVTAVDAEPGAVLAAGTPVLRVALDGPRDAVFSVPEDQVDALRALAARPGALQLRLWGDARPPQPLALREVAAAADAVTRTFLAKADVGQAPVRLGQTATVLLAGPAATVPVIKLPLAAVFEQGGRSQVWVLDRASMTVKRQAVGIAGAEGNQALIQSGLAAGQVVVTAGVHVLNDGQKVRLYAEPAAAAAAAAASRQAATTPITTSAASAAASR